MYYVLCNTEINKANTRACLKTQTIFNLKHTHRNNFREEKPATRDFNMAASKKLYGAKTSDDKV